MFHGLTRRTVFTAIFAGLLCYLWGLMTIYLEIFPYDQLRSAKQKLVADNVVSRHPRNLRLSQFELFSPNVDVVMVGDSLTEGGIWNEMFPELRVANRGITGDTTDKILNRIETILSTHPKKAFLMAGINDIEGQVGLEKLLWNYVRIVHRLQAAKIRVYIQSTVECNRSSCGEKLDKVRALNKRLKQFAAKNNLPYIDLNIGITSEADGLLDEFTSDGIHLTGMAYWHWREKLLPYMVKENLPEN